MCRGTDKPVCDVILRVLSSVFPKSVAALLDCLHGACSNKHAPRKPISQCIILFL